MTGITQFFIDKSTKLENENNCYFELYENALRNKQNNIPLIFFKDEEIKEEDKFNNSKFYLKKMQEIFEFSNEESIDIENENNLLSILYDKDDNFIITKDNFKKMVLLYYRIKANLPIILMDETG